MLNNRKLFRSLILVNKILGELKKNWVHKNIKVQKASKACFSVWEIVKQGFYEEEAK